MKVGFLHKVMPFAVPLFWALPFLAQHKVKIEKNYGEMDYAPQINGVFDGDIPFNQFCDPSGLVTRVGASILTFDLFTCTTNDKPIHIIGNEIPDSICAELLNHCLYTDVFINNIKAMDIDGSVKNLSPVRYFLIREEEE